MSEHPSSKSRDKFALDNNLDRELNALERLVAKRVMSLIRYAKGRCNGTEISELSDGILKYAIDHDQGIKTDAYLDLYSDKNEDTIITDNALFEHERTLAFKPQNRQRVGLKVVKDARIFQLANKIRQRLANGEGAEAKFLRENRSELEELDRELIDLQKKYTDALHSTPLTP